MNPALLNIIAVGLTLTGSVMTVIGGILLLHITWQNARHPGLKPHPIVATKHIQPSGQGFQWIRWDLAPQIIPQDAASDGAFWEGFTFGVSRNTGKAAGISIALYGAEQGAGHYTWRAKTNARHAERGAGGHSNLDHPTGREPWMQDSSILGWATDTAFDSINQFFRPLLFQYDAETGAVSKIYDPETGQNVFFTPDREYRDFFTFGPYPAADAGTPYTHQPGLHVLAKERDANTQQLTFKVRDVYGQPLDYAHVAITSETGFAYQQALPDGDSEMRVSVPNHVSEIHLSVSRAGYHTLSENIAFDYNAQRVDAVLEPTRKRMGTYITGPSE